MLQSSEFGYCFLFFTDFFFFRFRKVDIWGLGCVIIEMATAKTPWHEKSKTERAFRNPFRILYYIGNSGQIPEIPSNLSAAGQDFVRQCLERYINLFCLSLWHCTNFCISKLYTLLCVLVRSPHWSVAHIVPTSVGLYFERIHDSYQTLVTFFLHIRNLSPTTRWRFVVAYCCHSFYEHSYLRSVGVQTS